MGENAMTQALQQPIAPELIPARITLEQYHRMVDAGIWDNCHVELLNGVVVEMSPEGMPHASRSTTTGEYLIRTLEDRAQVRPAKPITLPSGSEPEPDIAIVRRMPDNYLSHHPYPEDIFWIIEYSNSSLDKDLGVKAKIYASEGIPEYWVINLKKNVLIVFRDPIDGKYQSRQEFTTGTISPLAFPDLAIEVGRLLV
jgi:Uma2 family endonuclease